MPIKSYQCNHFKTNVLSLSSVCSKSEWDSYPTNLELGAVLWQVLINRLELEQHFSALSLTCQFFLFESSFLSFVFTISAIPGDSVEEPAFVGRATPDEEAASAGDKAASAPGAACVGDAASS